MPSITVLELVEQRMAERKTICVKPPSRANPSGRQTKHINNLRTYFHRWLCPTPDPEALPGMLFAEHGRTLGELLAHELTAKRLHACKVRMIESKRLNADNINKVIRETKAMYKWAASPEMGLVPAGVWKELETVTELKQGRCQARSSGKKLPVPDQAITQTLSALQDVEGIRGYRLQAIIELLLLTGMRPNEVVQMSRSTIDMTPDAYGNWWYSPQEHKMQHKCKERLIPLGQRAQRIVLKLMESWHGEWLFPGQSADKHMGALAAYRAIDRVQEAHAIDRWAIGRLRNTFGTRTAKTLSDNDARVMLGHTNIETTAKHYITRDQERASQIAAKIG